MILVIGFELSSDHWLLQENYIYYSFLSWECGLRFPMGRLAFKSVNSVVTIVD